jgi:hypothetical protein
VQPALQVRHGANEAAATYVRLARYHQERGDLDLALQAYTHAIAREPRNLEARSGAAAIHAQQGRLEQARAMMLAVVADYPRAPQPLNNLGYIDYLRGDFAPAVAEMRKALALDPKNDKARNNLHLAETALAARVSQEALATMAAAAPAPALAAAAQAAAPVAPPAPVPAPAVVQTAAPAPVVAAVHAPAVEAAAPARSAPSMALVQIVPNVYELKAVPAMIAAPLPMVAQGPAAAAAPARLLPRSRVVVANGNGAPGLAKRVSGMLGRQGIAVASVVNERPYGTHDTRIQYREGFREQAEALRTALRGKVLLVASNTMAHADLRLSLGKDATRALALNEAGDEAVLLAAR